ncbi:7-deoxyloganetin glucosyltransferase-like [Iris pallida]|uniref:Glycosyltransferase n=1 Tax=Iris pallida TaxID=29817 RepID=A0AAX6DJ45_IRIPA|nr:7-deoxyloganetin glucosyltransferase-like [Iris pallida]
MIDKVSTVLNSSIFCIIFLMKHVSMFGAASYRNPLDRFLVTATATKNGSSSSSSRRSYGSARRLHPVPTARAHKRHAAAGQAPPLQRLPRHLRPHRVQLQPDPAGERRPFGPRSLAGLPLRDVSRRTADPRCDHRPVLGVAGPRGAEQLVPSGERAGEEAQPRSVFRARAAGDVHNFGRHHELRRRGRRGVRRPGVLFCSFSACGYMSSLQVEQLIQRGIVPLRSESDFSNGYLDTPLDWMPGTKNMRLKHVTAVVRTTDPNSIYLKFLRDEMEGSHRATAIVLNTFADLEGDILDAMSAVLPAPIYPVGPLTMFRSQALDTGGSSLWEKDSTCLEWLGGKAAGSVLYVNFGSLTVMTNEKLAEFAWGLADSGYDFLWVIRNDVAMGRPAVLPREFYAGTSGRGMLAGWCPQEEVLAHPSVGGFLTHCGWNSVVESIGAGVPMLCWPLAAEQHANCLYACAEWRIGMEVERDAKREGVAALVRELMGGARGKEMRARALQWKERATRTTRRGGKSFEMLERLIKEVLFR